MGIELDKFYSYQETNTGCLSDLYSHSKATCLLCKKVVWKDDMWEHQMLLHTYEQRKNFLEEEKQNDRLC